MERSSAKSTTIELDAASTTGVASTADTAIVTVSGPPGELYDLQIFQRQWGLAFDRSGDYWLSTIHSGHMDDNIDATGFLVAEVSGDHARNEIYHILFDGTVSDEHGFVGIGGHAETLTQALQGNYQESWDLPTAVRDAVKALSSAEGREIEAEAIEAGVLERTRAQRRKFRRLEDDEVAQILAG